MKESILVMYIRYTKSTYIMHTLHNYNIIIYIYMVYNLYIWYISISMYIHIQRCLRGFTTAGGTNTTTPVSIDSKLYMTLSLYEFVTL